MENTQATDQALAAIEEAHEALSEAVERLGATVVLDGAMSLNVVAAGVFLDEWFEGVARMFDYDRPIDLVPTAGSTN